MKATSCERSHKLRTLQTHEQAPQPSAMTSQGISRPALDPQAQKLKALVKKSQEQRAKSGTPPGPGSRQLRTTEGASSLRESPIHSGDSPDSPQDNSAKDSSTNEAIEALLSEVKAGANKNNKTQNNSGPSKLQQSKPLESGKISQTLPLAMSNKSTPQDTSSRSGAEARKIVNQRQSNGGSSEVSEGEIREDKSRLSKQSVGPKEVHNLTKSNNRDEQVLNKKRDEQIGKSQRVETRGTSRGQSPSPNPRASVSRNRDEEAEERSERKNYHSTSKYEQSREPELEQKPHQRDLRDSDEDNLKHESSYERKEESSSRKLEVPTLSKLLEVDEDLRDWLNYTGYHKTEYRNKVLNRRRAIAALDAQKAKLLEEMELEERGGLQTANTSQAATTSMLPPPIPSIVSVRTKKADGVTDRGKSDHSSTTSSKETGVKRTYTDYRGSRDEGPSEKTGRLDEQGRAVRAKTESQVDDRRSYPSSAYEPSLRRSPSTDSKTHRHEDRDKSIEERGRGRGRTYSQEREISPGLKAYESRPPARSKSYDFQEPEERDDRNGARPFIQVGNYRGRAYDPNYKYRGRGRGSWTTSHNIEPRSQSGYTNQRIASMKPYRDPKPLDRGGRGG
jgi:YTH domain-containing protein 1